MGIDLLDFTWRLEKRLQIRLRPQHLFLGEHTTVAEVVELLWQRVQGFEVEEDPELIRLYHELQMRIMPNFTTSLWDWMIGFRRETSQLDDMIPPEQRVQFWDALGRDLSSPLPPLEFRPGDAVPRFPDEISTQRRLLQLIRAQLFRRLKWIPIPASADTESPPKVWTRVKPWEFSIFGSWRYAEDTSPPRKEPWTREELFDVVREELVATLAVDFQEVTPDAELIDHLGLS